MNLFFQLGTISRGRLWEFFLGCVSTVLGGYSKIHGTTSKKCTYFFNLVLWCADLMLLLPMGSALQQAAVTCFAIQFWGTDHSFLHQVPVP
jgi:hypothetical protein